MAKGMFTQGVALLTDGGTTIDDIQRTLETAGLEIAKQVDAAEHWAYSGDSVVIPFKPEVNGFFSVDVVNEPWPDEMGDPREEPMIFGAWGMGNFGPYAYPAGLERAGQHAWAWQEGRTIADGHRGMVRIRLSYAFGVADDQPIYPEGIDPIEELMFLSDITIKLLKLPGVICYFNANGEVLRDDAAFCEFWDDCTGQGFIPLQLWTNVRFYLLNDDIGFMDTVGNEQIDVADVEAIFPTKDYDPSDIEFYLRNVTHHLLELEQPMSTGDDIDGPGENNLAWRVEVLDDSLTTPPRHVIRLYPKAMADTIRKTLERMKEE